MSKMLINLQLFADGAAAGAGATASGTAAASADNTGVTSPAAAEDNGRNGTDAGQVAAVDTATGTEPGAETNTQSDTPADYESFKKQFKKEFDAETQAIIKGRLAKTTAEVNRLKAAEPIITMLAERYGIKDASDLSALEKAIADDDAMYEAEADETGIPVDQLKRIKAAERESAKYKAILSERAEEERKQAQLSEWTRQSAETKSVYSSFNFAAEVQNPGFAKLLRSGVDVKTAYEVVHKDELLTGAVNFGAKKGEQIALGKLAANAARPAENPLGAGAPAQQTVDVSKMTREDFRKIRERVARGERVTL